MRTLIAASLAALVITSPALAEGKTPEAAAAACKAKGEFYKLSPAHKAGDISPTSGKPYKRDSNGVCRLDTKKVQEALVTGKLIVATTAPAPAAK